MNGGYPHPQRVHHAPLGKDAMGQCGQYHACAANTACVADAVRVLLTPCVCCQHRVCAADTVHVRPTLRMFSRHHTCAANNTRGWSPVCMAVYSCPFMKIFLCVVDFSKGKIFFSSKSSYNGLVSKKIEKICITFQGEGVRTQSQKNHLFFLKASLTL